MKDIPIIFSAPMVVSLLAGRKTMTRRMAWRDDKLPDNEGTDCRPSPWQKVKPGDRLWVRESIRHAKSGRESWVYAADGQPVEVPQDKISDVLTWSRAQKRAHVTAIHMLRLFSRITLVVTTTKIEPLRDISEDDAKAEGFSAGKIDDGFGPRDIGGGWAISSPGAWASAGGHFQLTWAKLHPEWDGYSSPDVVALSFNVERSNIDRIAA